MGSQGLSHAPLLLDDVYGARERIAGTVSRTPLLRFNVDETPARIFLKLENLQPIGSFKLRGATNAMALVDRRDLANGVWTASAGNMAQALAWVARRLNVPCTVVVPDHAPAVKLEAIRRLGAGITPVPFAQWVEIFRTRTFAGLSGLFVHPFSDRAVMAGNGTIALEILEELPDVDAVVIPYGGGGLACGIASVLRGLKPSIRIYAAEVETAAPLAASLAAGRPTEVRYTPSFVDGIGAPVVFPEMWELACQLLDGSIVVSLRDVAEAIRLLVERNRIVAEGAGAAPVGAALTGSTEGGTVVCIVSGGNIDPDKLAKILGGHLP